MLELNKINSTDIMEDFSILNNYFDICHQYETTSHLYETQSINNIKNGIFSKLYSDSFKSRMNQVDKKIQNYSISQSKCSYTSDYQKNETHRAKKPPRPPPPTNLNNFDLNEQKINSIFFSKYSSTSSPVCQMVSSSPSTLNFPYHHSKNQNQINYQNKNHILKQAEYLDKCLGEKYFY